LLCASLMCTVMVLALFFFFRQIVETCAGVAL
jgi:hypothetical protein